MNFIYNYVGKNEYVYEERLKKKRKIILMVFGCEVGYFFI